MDNEILRDDHHWPSLKPDIAGASDELLEQTRAEAEAQGYRVGSQRAEAELQRMREANAVCVNDAMAVASSLDADLAALLVQCIEKVAAAVVGVELRAGDGVAYRLVDIARAELKAQAVECLLEVADEDVEFYAELVSDCEVRGMPDIDSPGFRLIHGFARREFRPDELITAALANLGQTTQLERAKESLVDSS